MEEQERTPGECLAHNADPRCPSVCGIGCRPGTCDCECTHLACPVGWPGGDQRTRAEVEADNAHLAELDARAAAWAAFGEVPGLEA